MSEKIENTTERLFLLFILLTIILIKVHEPADRQLSYSWSLLKEGEFSESISVFLSAVADGYVLTYAAGQVKIGELYEEGNGFGKDTTAALNWYQKACDNGSESGCEHFFNLNALEVIETLSH